MISLAITEYSPNDYEYDYGTDTTSSPFMGTIAGDQSF